MPEINPLAQGSIYAIANSRRNSQNTPRVINEQAQQTENRQPQSPNRNRVIRISESAVSIEADNFRNPRNESQRASVNQSPISQYQTNQQLLRRQELDEIVGIDLFV